MDCLCGEEELRGLEKHFELLVCEEVKRNWIKPSITFALLPLPPSNWHGGDGRTSQERERERGQL